MTKHILLFFVCGIFLVSCTKNTTTPPDSSNGGFTPPTTSYYKVDGISSNVSADAPSEDGNSFGVTKSFSFAGHQINGAVLANFAPRYSTVLTSIPEGTSKPFYLSLKNYTDSRDTATLYLEMDDYPKGIYVLRASSGKIYISRINDTLRCTSDGVLTVTGNNTQPPGESQTRTLEFSIRKGISF